MKSLMMLVLFVASVVWAQNSNEYRAEYDQSVMKVAAVFHPDIQKILLQDNVGKSLMFLPIIKVEVLNNNELEIFTEYCSRKIRVQQYRGGMTGQMPIRLSSISEGSCSGD